MTFAGCSLDPTTFAAWQQHWVPHAQPFFVSDALAQRLPALPRFTRREFHQSGVPLSLHDTLTTYNVAPDPPWVVWLTFEAFACLGGAERLNLLHEQRDFGRAGVIHLDEVTDQLEPRTLTALAALTTDGYFVWWSRLWELLPTTEQQSVLQRFVETDRLPCRRHNFTPDHWDRVATLLPGAGDLAGSFLPESGGNCLSTVMATFGAPAVAERWEHPEPFERWLERFTALPKSDVQKRAQVDELGNVLVWRDESTRVQHAAVSLGEGFVLHKEAQSWHVPRQVTSLDEALVRWQDDGQLGVYRSRKALHSR